MLLFYSTMVAIIYLLLLVLVTTFWIRSNYSLVYWIDSDAPSD